VIRRREFITLLGGAAAWPLATRAQQPGMRRIGVLISDYTQTDREGQARIAAFLDTFQRLGWTDGRNVRIDYRWDAGDAEHIKASAAELIHSAPDVIVVMATPALVELRRLTSTIPIVFTQVGDPVGNGFVAGLARPGGNYHRFPDLRACDGRQVAGTAQGGRAQPEPGGCALRFGLSRQCRISGRG
jgi:putative ABC transport system substrate-binding protein